MLWASVECYKRRRFHRIAALATAKLELPDAGAQASHQTLTAVQLDGHQGPLQGKGWDVDDGK